jgi:spermidine dehydrogenase
LTQLRGQTNADFQAMHAIRDGTFWDRAGPPAATGEHYDLIVIGAGISGLASAFPYRQRMSVNYSATGGPFAGAAID